MPQATIDPGNQPLRRPSRADAINALNNLVAAFATTSEPSAPQLLPLLSEIDHGIATDTTLQTEVQQRNRFPFQFWQVEQLLDQTADLLDRGLKDRETYNCLRVEFTRLLIELAEFHELDRIHADEIAEGWYTVEFDQSKPAADAAAAERDGYSGAAGIASGFVGSEYTNVADRVQAAGVAAKVSSYSAYKGQHAAGLAPSEDNHDVGWGHVGETMVRPSDGYAGDGTDGSYTHGKAAGTAIKSNVLHDIVRDQYLHSLNVEKTGFGIQQSSFSTESSSADARFKSLDRKQKWDKKDIAFRRARTEAAILVNDLKVRSVIEPGGAYNYPERLTPIRHRFRRDFWDGYTRLQAARDGLQRLFDYDISDFPVLSGATPDTSPAFDDCLIWTRQAIRFLVAFRTSEQSYAMPISLKALIGKKAWKAAKEAVEDDPSLPFTIAFVLDEAHFPVQSFVRLQGVSVFTVGREGPFRVGVRVPAKAVCIFPHRSAPVPIDQSDVRPVWLRAMDRKTPRSGDVAGVSSIRNASPVSDRSEPGAEKFWRVVVDRTSALGENALDLEDINLDLYIAAQVFQNA